MKATSAVAGRTQATVASPKSSPFESNAPMVSVLPSSSPNSRRTVSPSPSAAERPNRSRMSCGCSRRPNCTQRATSVVSTLVRAPRRNARTPPAVRKRRQRHANCFDAARHPSACARQAHAIRAMRPRSATHNAVDPTNIGSIWSATGLPYCARVGTAWHRSRLGSEIAPTRERECCSSAARLHDRLQGLCRLQPPAAQMNSFRAELKSAQLRAWGSQLVRSQDKPVSTR
jgi:hypothetical protein